MNTALYILLLVFQVVVLIGLLRGRFTDRQNVQHLHAKLLEELRSIDRRLRANESAFESVHITLERVRLSTSTEGIAYAAQVLERALRAVYELEELSRRTDFDELGFPFRELSRDLRTTSEELHSSIRALQ